MTSNEIDVYLSEQRAARVATSSADEPHVAPLWFCWDGNHLWLYSLVRSLLWAEVIADPRIAVVIDSGDEYFELRGVEIIGTAEPVGEAPRIGEPNDALVAVEHQFARTYLGGDRPITPTTITSWDFRKIGAGASNTAQARS